MLCEIFPRQLGDIDILDNMTVIIMIMSWVLVRNLQLLEWTLICDEQETRDKQIDKSFSWRLDDAATAVSSAAAAVAAGHEGILLPTQESMH